MAAVGLCAAATTVHAVGMGGGAHSTIGGGEWASAAPLPVVRPAPATAAAGESPTASAPLPVVYGYTPEQRVGTERQESGKLSSRRQTQGERLTEPMRVGAPEQLERPQRAGGGRTNHLNTSFLGALKERERRAKEATERDENGKKNRRIQ